MPIYEGLPNLNTGGQGQKSQRGGGGGVSFLGWGKFFQSEGGYPPSIHKLFRLRHSLLLTVPFFMIYLSVNDVVIPPQAKIVINGLI